MNPDVRTPVAEPDLAARQGAIASIFFIVVTAFLALGTGLSRPLGFSADLVERLAYATEVSLLIGFLGCAAFAAVFAVVPRAVGAGLHNEVLGATSILAWSALTLVLLGLIVVGQTIPAPVFGLYVFLGITIAYNTLLTTVRRYEKRLYPSVGFAVASVLAAPLAMLGYSLPLTGDALRVTTAFSTGLAELVWLGGAAMAAAFWLVPLITSSPLFSGRLARITLITLVISGAGFGLRQIGEDISTEAAAIGSAMAVLALLPALTALSVLMSTARDRWDAIGWAPPLRFVAAGLTLWTAYIATSALLTIPGAKDLRLSSEIYVALRFLGWWGGLAMMLFAGLYYVYPLTVGRHWESKKLVSIHFFGTVSAVLILVAAHVAKGLVELALSTSGVSEFGADGFGWAFAFGYGLLAVAQFSFAVNAARTSRRGEPLTLFAVTPAEPIGATS